jgi:hypothetical protein
MTMEQPEESFRDGFQITKRVFAYDSPQDTSHMDAVTKRNVTICNLFANHELTIKDIARVLDESYSHVVNTLILEGLILERRTKHELIYEVDRRTSYFRRL